MIREEFGTPSSERLGQETALAAELLRLLIDSVPDYAIYVLDPRGRVISWNSGAERIKGYRAEEIIGKHFSVFYPRADVEAGKCEHELEVAARTGRCEDEGWRVRKDGTTFWANVVITALRDESGRVCGFAKITRDLTLRVHTQAERMRRARAEERARRKGESGATLRRELRDMAQRPWLAYVASIVFAFAACGLHRALEPLLGDPLRFTFYFPAVCAAAFLGGLAPGLVATIGSTVLVLLTNHHAPPLGLAAFVFTGVGASAVSQLARRAFQTSAKARQAREQLLAIVAHDLRNPLNAVLLSARMLSTGAGSDPERVAVTIERNAARMDHLIRDLLDATRLETNGELPIVMKAEDPRSLIRDAMESADPQARAKNVTLDASLPVDLPHVRCDRERVLQVLSNLLGNALGVTLAGGQITLRLAEAGGLLRFEVADTGPGIAAADMPHLFERHWKGHASSGTGLGLFIAAGIIRAHGGRIWCHSEPGYGASFFFVLPAIKANASLPPRAIESFRLS